MKLVLLPLVFITLVAAKKSGDVTELQIGVKYKPATCEVQAHKGDKVKVHYRISGSTMLNLSLLTSDMWAVLIRIFAYHEKVDWMYFVAFAAVTAGLIVYSVGDKMEENPAEVGDEEAEQSKCFDEEAGMSKPDHNFASSSAIEKDELASNDDLKKEREGKKF